MTREGKEMIICVFILGQHSGELHVLKWLMAHISIYSVIKPDSLLSVSHT